MFDIGWSELMMIGIVALIVIGPKDLPDMFRTLGRFTAKARGMARDFQRAMDSAADDAGVKDVAKDLKNMTSSRSMGLDAVKDAAAKFEKWDPMAPRKPAAATTLTPDPAAVAPGDGPDPVGTASTMGPQTQALAETQAAKRAARIAQSQAAKQGAGAPATEVAKADPSGVPPPKARVAPKAVRKPKEDAAAKTVATPKAPAKAKAVNASGVAKSARKARGTDRGDA